MSKGVGRGLHMPQERMSMRHGRKRKSSIVCGGCEFVETAAPEEDFRRAFWPGANCDASGVSRRTAGAGREQRQALKNGRLGSAPRLACACGVGVCACYCRTCNRVRGGRASRCGTGTTALGHGMGTPLAAALCGQGRQPAAMACEEAALVGGCRVITRLGCSDPDASVLYPVRRFDESCAQACDSVLAGSLCLALVAAAHTPRHERGDGAMSAASDTV